MKLSSILRVFLKIGGCLFWFLLIAWAFLTLLLKGCESNCYSEVLVSETSPSGEQKAEISIGDCGGATTDFYGSVDVYSDNPRLTAEKVFSFAGRPEEIGLELRWVSDTELVISINDMAKVRRINPNGRKSSDLKIQYEYRK